MAYTGLCFLIIVSDVIEALSLDVLPFIVLLIVPVLGRMSDQDHSVRLMATHCFATLIKLLPLEVGVSQCYFNFPYLVSDTNILATYLTGCGK